MKNFETVKTNQVLPDSSKAVNSCVESMQDRIAKQRILTAAFVSEHCLPFSLAGDILDLAKRLAEDKAALDKTTLSRTSAAYVNTHGLAKSFKEEIKAKVKDNFVSLNIDEATYRNNDKVLNIIVQYCDEESGKVVLDHLGSRIQNIATAVEIVKSIESVLKEYEIKWSQVLSVLMDNCSTMRGVKGGVEALNREKNDCLLDVSGDTVHMISNVAKTLMKHVDSGLQSICRSLPNMITCNEEGNLAMELNNYSVDRQVKVFSDDYADGNRVDLDFWSKVAHLKTFDNQRYPVLSKLVHGLLTIFSGPLVEGTFNVLQGHGREYNSTLNLNRAFMLLFN